FPRRSRGRRGCQRFGRREASRAVCPDSAGAVRSSAGAGADFHDNGSGGRGSPPLSSPRANTIWRRVGTGAGKSGRGDRGIPRREPVLSTGRGTGPTGAAGSGAARFGESGLAGVRETVFVPGPETGEHQASATGSLDGLGGC